MGNKIVSRRGVLAAGSGAAGATVLTAHRAEAAVSYAPGSYPATAVLPTQDRHLVNRFSYGLTPALAAQVSAAGGAVAWVEQQLLQAYDPDESLTSWWPDLALSPATLLQRDRTGVRAAYRVMQDYGKQLLVRRGFTSHQVREVLTEFWENHLHVPAVDDLQFVVRVGYGDVMRRNALSRFDTILFDAITHPAMLIFLDNVGSTARHPNENLARELLELHTVGLGNYDEDDVKECARILTGWRVNATTGAPEYAAAQHSTGPVSVMGFSDPNASSDGREVTRRFLNYLARHPATARRLAHKLVLAFVSDTPPPALVDRLAATYLASDTQVAPVLRELWASAEFRDSLDAKLRDPAQDMVASIRVMGTTFVAPKSPDDYTSANILIPALMTMAPAPMAWPRPDGLPLEGSMWASPSRVMASIALHGTLAAATPTTGITFRKPASWVPRTPIVFRDLVDHLARTLHGRVSDAALLQACCEATVLTPTISISATHRLVTKDMPLLLAVFLDHPAHLYR